MSEPWPKAVFGAQAHIGNRGFREGMCFDPWVWRRANYPGVYYSKEEAEALERLASFVEYGPNIQLPESVARACDALHEGRKGSE